MIVLFSSITMFPSLILRFHASVIVYSISYEVPAYILLDADRLDTVKVGVSTVSMYCINKIKSFNVLAWFTI